MREMYRCTQPNGKFLFQGPQNKYCFHIGPGFCPYNIEKGMKYIFFGNVCISGEKKCSFFEKLGVLCFLVTPILRFALLPCYQQIFKAQ